MRVLKAFSPVHAGAGVVLALVQWWQIAYRVRLFYRDYAGEPYTNHVGDDVFVIVHVFNASFVILGVFLAFRLWSQSGWWWRFSVIVTCVNAAAWLTFVYLHASGILVGYLEFMHQMKGE